MQRSPPIINLYDKPRHPRRAQARHAESSGLGTALLSCLAITIATAGFFWCYDAIAHRGDLYLPSLVRVATSERHSVQAPEALAPDMNAPEVVRANADVPPSALQKNVANETEHSSAGSITTVTPKKKAHLVRRISPEARQSYASAPTTFSRSAPFGGW